MAKITLDMFKSAEKDMTNDELCVFRRYTENSPYLEGHKGIWAIATVNDAVYAVLHIGEAIVLTLDGVLDNKVMGFDGLGYMLEWLNTKGICWAIEELRYHRQIQHAVELS